MAEYTNTEIPDYPGDLYQEESGPFADSDNADDPYFSLEMRGKEVKKTTKFVKTRVMEIAGIAACR